MLFLAERIGAEQLVGIELDKNRYEGATQLAELLQSQVQLHQCDFLEFDETRRFDHVYILNVIHHVNDFFRFLEKAATACTKSLTLEFPTLSDNKFANFHKLSQTKLGRLNNLPLVGISSDKGAGQTFVYSPEAIRHLVMNEIGGFEMYEVKESAINNRIVMTFFRNNRRVIKRAADISAFRERVKKLVRAVLSRLAVFKRLKDSNI